MACVKLVFVWVGNTIGVLNFVCPVISLILLFSVDRIGCHIPHHTFRFVCFVFRVHQQGPQSVDRFMVCWYVVGLENPCQLFKHLTNVGHTYHVTYDMLSSVGFSGDFSLVV